jgi:hypothetical protein
MKRFFSSVSMILLGFICNCAQSSTLDTEHANSQLFSAASYKSRECGNPIPTQALYVVSDNVPQRNIDLCTYAILRTSCPFDSFPTVCVLIYLEELGSFPKFINFGDLVNEKL